MIEVGDFLEAVRANRIDFFVGVPDSLLKSLCAALGELPVANHLVAANEGGAVGIAAGHYLATGRPALVYLQNSGLGNTVNPLLSLADPDVYGIPMLLVVGWRGRPGFKDEPQHVKQGRVSEQSFEAMEIPYFVVEGDTDLADVMAQANAVMMARSGPVALLVAEGTFAPYKAKTAKPVSELSLSREEAIARTVAHFDETTAVVSTTGHISRELYELRQTGQSNTVRDFLTVGSMGHASSIALGMALARPERQVVCLDGDGALLMHLGALPIIAASAPKNLLHVVLNNGAHDSVGGQPTVGFECDFAKIAEASGYRFVRRCETAEEIDATLKQALTQDGPAFIEIRVRTGARSDLGRPKSTPRENRDALMAWLGSKA
jgi:phosphonopyruvate decarboxylase